MKKPYSNVAEHYSMGKELGRGRYGVIRMCKHKQREERLACKMISKSKLASVREVEDVQREVKVMELLKGHPAVIELKATYEDQRVRTSGVSTGVIRWIRVQQEPGMARQAGNMLDDAT